jgi:hypothetical protein
MSATTARIVHSSAADGALAVERNSMDATATATRPATPISLGVALDRPAIAETGAGGRAGRRPQQRENPPPPVV